MKENPTAQEAASFFMGDFEKKEAERRKGHVEILKERIGFLESRIVKDQAEIVRRRKEIDALLTVEEQDNES